MKVHRGNTAAANRAVDFRGGLSRDFSAGLFLVFCSPGVSQACLATVALGVCDYRARAPTVLFCSLGKPRGAQAAVGVLLTDACCDRFIEVFKHSIFRAKHFVNGGAP